MSTSDCQTMLKFKIIDFMTKIKYKCLHIMCSFGYPRNTHDISNMADAIMSLFRTYFRRPVAMIVRVVDSYF